MRGKARFSKMSASVSRITPAYAGKRLTLHKIWQTVRDHPRLCGEKGAFPALSHRELGSPPPMRGKVSVKLDALATAGITPAYAGKRYCLKDRLTRSEDHPRLCGEKSSMDAPHAVLSGSPPPMRGKDCRSADNVQRIRITPAYAGKRQVRCRCPPERQDHPRLCGEKFTCFTIVFPPDGSPPPMRGKVPEQGLIRLRDGITHAYAGKSTLQKHLKSVNLGSPPPMRGKADCSVKM